MNTIEIIHQLRRAKGTNRKLEILKEHEDNELWKTLLIYTYDTRKVYYVSSPNELTFKDDEVNDYLFVGLELLATRGITGNEAKRYVIKLSETYGEVARLALGRSLKAGITATTINKAYPGFIPVFVTMKGKDVPIEDYPVLSSIKFDGVKIFVRVEETETTKEHGAVDVTIMTSSGADFTFKSLEDYFMKAPEGVYEGELVNEAGKQVDRPIITGKLNSLMAGTVDDIDDYNYYVYDYVSLDQWDNKEGTIRYDVRLASLTETISKINHKTSHVWAIDQTTHHNIDEVVEYFNSLTAKGFEGSMHRYPEDVYMFTGEKRTIRLIKKKSIKQCILKCIGTVAHSNPAKGVTGALICEGMVKGGKYVYNVKVGSGLSKMDIQRDGQYFVGEQIEILYNVVTETEKGYSLFLPRFKRIVGDL